MAVSISPRLLHFAPDNEAGKPLLLVGEVA